MRPRGSRIVIAVPCYNESARLPTDTICCFLDKHEDVDLVLVNDGSTDDTSRVLHQLSATMGGRAWAVDLPANRGKAEAVRSGILEAFSHDPAYVGFWDADLATPLEAIADLRDALELNPDAEMAFGSRVRLMGRQIERRAWRHYVGRVFATVVSTMLRLPIYDTQCGAKLFRMSGKVHALFSEPFVTRWTFDVEILARRIRMITPTEQQLAPIESLIIEVPLRAWSDVPGSKLRPRDAFRAAIEVAHIAVRYHPWRRWSCDGLASTADASRREGGQHVETTAERPIANDPARQ